MRSLLDDWVNEWMDGCMRIPRKNRAIRAKLGLYQLIWIIFGYLDIWSKYTVLIVIMPIVNTYFCKISQNEEMTTDPIINIILRLFNYLII